MKKVLFIGCLLVLVLCCCCTLGTLYLTTQTDVLTKYFTGQYDLGIKPDPALVDAFDKEFGIQNKLDFSTSPVEGELVYSGSKDVETTFTSEEVTSIIDRWSNMWAYTPIKSVQVRINADGTSEASGVLDVSKAIEFAMKLGYTTEEIEQGKSYAQITGNEIPFYAKGTGSVTNNVVDLSVSELSIYGVSIPVDISSVVEQGAELVIMQRMAQVTGLNVRSIDISGGDLKFDATIPTTVEEAK